MGASERGQTIRQSFPALNRIAVAAGDVGKTRIGTAVTNLPGTIAKQGVGFLNSLNIAPGSKFNSVISSMAASTATKSGGAAWTQIKGIAGQTKVGKAVSGVADFGGKAFGLGKAVASPS